MPDDEEYGLVDDDPMGVRDLPAADPMPTGDPWRPKGYVPPDDGNSITVQRLAEKPGEQGTIPHEWLSLKLPLSDASELLYALDVLAMSEHGVGVRFDDLRDALRKELT